MWMSVYIECIYTTTIWNCVYLYLIDILICTPIQYSHVYIFPLENRTMKGRGVELTTKSMNL